MKESAKRRKSKAQIQEEKKEEEKKQQEIKRKVAEYDKMQAKMAEAHKVWNEKENYRQLYDHLIGEGVIKQDETGNIIPIEDPSERESIRSKTKQKRLADQSQQEDSQSNQFEFEDQIQQREPDKMDGLS